MLASPTALPGVGSAGLCSLEAAWRLSLLRKHTSHSIPTTIAIAIAIARAVSVARLSEVAALMVSKQGPVMKIGASEAQDHTRLRWQPTVRGKLLRLSQ